MTLPVNSVNKNILPRKEFLKRVLRYFLSMILTGMGPVDKMESESAKLFASFYALFSGIVFLGTAAIFIAPIAHRLLHVLHVESEEKKNESYRSDHFRTKRS
ncbi:MAG: hypothetical protein IPG99_01035 [Ignavibacteria bacterium]|nr:hypothetical protein [Ignavibacteria bacterium]